MSRLGVYQKNQLNKKGLGATLETPVCKGSPHNTQAPAAAELLDGLGKLAARGQVLPGQGPHTDKNILIAIMTQEELMMVSLGRAIF